MSSSWDSRGVSELQGISWEVWGLNPKLAFPAQSTRARKRYPHNIWLWKAAGFLSTRKWKESTGDAGTLLKGQHTKFCWPFTLNGSPPFTLGPSMGWTKHTSVAWGEYWVCGSGDKPRGTKIPVLSNFSILQSPSFLGGALPSLWHQPGRKQ